MVYVGCLQAAGINPCGISLNLDLDLVLQCVPGVILVELMKTF